MFSLDGRKMMWVWHPEASGGVEAIVQRALRFGVTALAFKHDDGGKPFSDAGSTFGVFPATIARYRDVCHWCGIKFGLWGYHYGQDWQAEAMMVERALSFQPDFYIVDWEAEFERAMTSQETLARYLRRIYDAREIECMPDTALYHAPLAQPSHHTPWQYQMFQYAFDGMLPQIYHGAMELPLDTALALSYSDYVTYNLMHKPIYPIGQAYDIPAGDITAWGTRASSIYGAKGLGWWDFETATDDMMLAISRVPLEDNMRRVNGTHPDFPYATARVKWEVGMHGINCRSGFGLLATDRRVVLDLHLTPVIPIKTAPVVIVRDGDCSYADQFDEVSGYRKNVTAYMHSNPDGAVLFEVQGGPVWVELVGILEAGS